MKTLLSLLSLLALTAPAVVPWPATSATPDQGQVRVEGDQVVLSFGDQGLPVVKLLEALAEVSGVPVFFAPTTVGDTRLSGFGDLSVPRAAFRESAEALLREADFLLSDERTPVVAMRVHKLGVLAGRGLRDQLVNEMIAVDALDEEPLHRGALYTTVLPLEHVDARSAMASFQPFFDTAVEGIRNVEASNALVLTSPYLDKLRHVVALARLADHPRLGESKALVRRVAELETSLAAIRAQVESLQAAAEAR